MFAEGGSNTDADSQLLTSQHTSSKSNIHRKVPKTTLSNKNSLERFTSRKPFNSGKVKKSKYIFQVIVGLKKKNLCLE